ncbi:MAG: sigma-70 family RNA polymerase sigma factor [Leucobacter sp.]|nr:sigma-70 family RNA polymerase sigma factor [Leucobacter sp.]
MPELNKLALRLAASHDELRAELKASLVRRGASFEDAEDIVSATIATALSLSDERIAEVENLRAYLHAVARNMYAKHGKDLSRSEPRDHVDLEQGIVETGFSSIEDEQTRRLAVRAFQQLPTRARDVLWQIIVEEKTSKQIAQSMGVTVTSVTTQAQRAKVALREAYIAEFIALTPPDCGFKPEALARIVSGNATKRAREKYAAHLQTCKSCPKLESAARDEATWVRSLISLIALGGAAGGALSRAADRPQGHGSARASRRFIGAAGVAVCIGLLCVWLSAAGAHLPLPNGEGLAISFAGGASVGSSSDREVAAHTLSVAVTPERLALPMPPAGGREPWAVEARSESSMEGHLLASARVSALSYESEPARLAISVRPPARPGQETAASSEAPQAWLTGAGSEQYLYLGSISPGETLEAAGTILRNANDIDQTAAARTDIEFLLVDTVPAGTRVGDELARLPEDTARLVTTGTSHLQVSVPLGLFLLGGGTLLAFAGRHRAQAIRAHRRSPRA